jgi:undecaprenyl-diphosphatase
MRSLLHKFDHTITTSIQHWPDWVHPVMSVVTFIGQPVLTVGIGIVVTALAWGWANLRLFFAGVTVLATSGIGVLLKLLLQRDRPITDYVLAMRFDTFSLPSGHALGATVAYGLLAYLAWQFLPAPWSYAAVFLFVLLIVAVGLSRIYLGAHYPSDVIAGWLLGALAMAVIIFVIRPQV